MGHFDFSPSKTGFSIFKNKEHSTVKGVINTYVDPEIHCISAYGLPFPSIPRSPSIIIRFTAASHALRQRIFTGITLLFVTPKIISLASRCCSDSIVSNLQSIAEVLPGVEIACHQAPWNTSVSSSWRMSIFSRCTTPPPHPSYKSDCIQ